MLDTGVHNEYLDALVDGALLCEQHEEVQRELTQLLATLLQLLPLLRDLNFVVRAMLALSPTSTILFSKCMFLITHLPSFMSTARLLLQVCPTSVTALIASTSAATCLPFLSILAFYFQDVITLGGTGLCSAPCTNSAQAV